MRTFNYSHFLIVLFLAVSCQKSSFLTANPDSSLMVPTTLQNYQALLDDDRVINGYGNSGYPSLGETGSDDYTVSAGQYKTYSVIDQRAAIWAAQIYTGQAVNDWDLPYRTVASCNIVLDGLKALTLPPAQQPTAKGIRGAAYFDRAFAFYQLSQIFSPIYDSNTSGSDWGIPLRLSSDVNEKISRATVQQTYDQIITDLGAARVLLPTDSSWKTTRPSIAAVYGLFSLVYLSARNYLMALQYADSCLMLRHALMSYDTISTTTRFPFYRFNPEVIFNAAYFRSGPAAPYRSNTDSLLFQSYQPNDLRKKLFFKSGSYFTGWYDEEGYAFCGISTDEMLLTRAECYARAGNVSAAMHDLNSLLVTRWAAGTFIPYTASGADDALQQILGERRKELLFRGTRWTDLRRLNKDPRTAHTLTRTVDGNVYTLAPTDGRWTYAIPDYILLFNPGMPQTSRW
ncbi:MAG TPA: RagB/SusD family nutrient uptake outer membrane protein [Puia sp.]|nr:RagB/SusD family nutrient uptake outer membrane protein [Puia sp.]